MHNVQGQYFDTLERLRALNEHMAILQQRRLRFHLVVMIALLFHILLKIGVVHWIVGESKIRRRVMMGVLIATLSSGFLWAALS